MRDETCTYSYANVLYKRNWARINNAGHAGKPRAGGGGGAAGQYYLRTWETADDDDDDGMCAAIRGTTPSVISCLSRHKTLYFFLFAF